MKLYSRSAVEFALTIVAVLTVCFAGYAGVKFGRLYGYNQLCCSLSRADNINLSLLELLGMRTYYSQTLQDRLLILSIYPSKTDGFFLDVGSADGIQGSNSKALEDRGWKGLCIDPFPKNMQTRTCMVFQKPVDSESGRTVEFRMAGDLGGIETYLGRWKNSIAQRNIVTLTTSTLTAILDSAGAPPLIDYMSLDIEGAELAALQGLSFAKYKIGVMTIEHNYEEPKRSDIRHFLESKGYGFFTALNQDDVYIHPDVKPRTLGQ